MSDIDPEVFRKSLAKVFEDCKTKPARRPQFVGLSGVGAVCPSEYRDIVNRAGPYAKGGPLDLGDDFYAAHPTPPAEGE